MASFGWPFEPHRFFVVGSLLICDTLAHPLSLLALFLYYLYMTSRKCIAADEGPGEMSMISQKAQAKTSQSRS